MTNHPSHQLTTEVKLLQKIAVWHGETFLILKRAEGPGYRSGKWDLPGGNSEWPQSTADMLNPHLLDLVREVKEETGLILDFSKKKDLIELSVGSYFEAEKSLYSIVVGWQYVLPNNSERPVIHLSDEHTDFQWITKAEFDQFDFGFAGEKDGFIRQVVEKARNESQSVKL